MNLAYKNQRIYRAFLIILFALYPVFILFWYKGYFITISLLISAALILDIISSPGKVWFDKTPIVCYFFFLLPLITTIWSKYPDETLWRGTISIANIGIFYLFHRTSKKNRRQTISQLAPLIIFTISVTFLIIYIEYGTVRATSREMKELVGSIANAGTAMALPCLPYLVAPGIVKNSTIRMSGIIACIFTVLLSQSRGAFLLLILLIPLLTIYYPASLRYRLNQLIKFFVVSSLTIWVAHIQMDSYHLFQSTKDRFSTSQILDLATNLTPDKQRGDYGRAIIITEGISAIKEHPLLGIGYGGMSKFIEERQGHGRVSHNIIITAWGEMGVIGLISLIWLFFILYFHLYKYIKDKSELLEDRMLACATLTSLTIIFLHAQLRPFFSNPVVPIILAQAYSFIKRTRKIQI